MRTVIRPFCHPGTVRTDSEWDRMELRDFQLKCPCHKGIGLATHAAARRLEQVRSSSIKRSAVGYNCARRLAEEADDFDKSALDGGMGMGGMGMGGMGMGGGGGGMDMAALQQMMVKPAPSLPPRSVEMVSSTCQRPVDCESAGEKHWQKLITWHASGWYGRWRRYGGHGRHGGHAGRAAPWG